MLFAQDSKRNFLPLKYHKNIVASISLLFVDCDPSDISTFVTAICINSVNRMLNGTNLSVTLYNR